MAVELAKVALWLHTFTVGAPLSFLDHHLRCGDSLFGEWVGLVSKELHQMGALFMQNALAGMSAATSMMNDISELSDADIAEVTQSKYLFESVAKTLKPLHQLLDFWHALRWLSPQKFNHNGKHFPRKGLAPLLSYYYFRCQTLSKSMLLLHRYFLANLNTFVMDFVIHQKVQSTHINWYILEQLPFISPDVFEPKIGGQKIADFIREQVLHLTYTAVDMRPFAIDMGYNGEPFIWDSDDRRHRMARLDALFFHLYQLDKNDASYILEQFPIVRANDEKIFGHYLTSKLIWGYMNAIEAGDLESVVQF